MAPVAVEYYGCLQVSSEGHTTLLLVTCNALMSIALLKVMHLSVHILAHEDF